MGEDCRFDGHCPTCGQSFYGEALARLQDRIARAIAALDAAPDPAGDEASKREAHTIQSANPIARTILAEGTEPAQRR